MFCNHCGTKINEGVRFCPSCGGKIGEVSTNVIERQKNANFLSNDLVLRRYGYSLKTMIGQIFSLIIYIIGFAIEFALYYTIKDSGGVIRISYNMVLRFDESILLFLKIFMVADVIYAIITLAKCPAISRMSLCICDDRLYGTTGKNFYFTTEEFEVSYSDILDVKCKFGGALVIETKMATYKCIIEDRKDAQAQIWNQMSRLRN